MIDQHKVVHDSKIFFFSRVLFNFFLMKLKLQIFWVKSVPAVRH